MATPAVRDINISCDLNSLPRVVSVPGSLFTGDMMANRIVLRVTKGGQPVTVRGTVGGYVVKPDGSVISAGSSRGSPNIIYYILPPAALTLPGPILVILKCTDGTAVTTLAACRCMVHPT
jgi:hypothetical protein